MMDILTLIIFRINIYFRLVKFAVDGNYNDENEKNYYELSNDLNFTINILDNSCGPTSQNSFGSMVYFYKEMLTKVYKNEKWRQLLNQKE